MQAVLLEFNMHLVKVQSANFTLGKLPAYTISCPFPEIVRNHNHRGSQLCVAILNEPSGDPICYLFIFSL